MDSRKHLYFITVSDVQRVASETIGRSLSQDELGRVTSRILEDIQWYDPVEAAILDEANDSVTQGAAA